MRRTTIGLVSAAVAVGAVATFGAPAHAAAPSGGCPSNWTLIYYPSLDPAYQVPIEVDSPDNNLSFGHQPGNGNEYVCALPLGKPTASGLQFYNFMDDSLKAG